MSSVVMHNAHKSLNPANTISPSVIRSSVYNPVSHASTDKLSVAHPVRSVSNIRSNVKEPFSPISTVRSGVYDLKVLIVPSDLLFLNL